MLLSLSKYAQFWRFNETLFAPLAALLGSHAAAVRAGALLTLALALVLAWRRTEPVAAATAVVVASLLLAPNVLPWYALWLLPLLVLRDEPAALLFTGTVSLAYVVYPDWQSGEPWKLGWGWRALEYGPCAAVALRTWREASGEAASAASVNGSRRSTWPPLDLVADLQHEIVGALRHSLEAHPHEPDHPAARIGGDRGQVRLADEAAVGGEHLEARDHAGRPPGEEAAPNTSNSQ